MVGLYHKRRAQRSHSRILGYLIKALMTLGLFVVVGFVLIVVFFNGSQIRHPLSSYLSSRTGFDVTIEDADFSPLYPDVIKIYQVSFGQSKIDELYLDYDLSSLIGSERFIINDFYINGLKLNPDDFKKLVSSSMGYDSIYAEMVRLHHTPLKTNFLRSEDATIRLNKVGFDQKNGLTFRSGTLGAGKAHLFQDEVTDFAIGFENSDQGLTIKDFTASMLGGVVTGCGRYLPHDDNSSDGGDTASLITGSNNSVNYGADIVLDELNLSKVIIKDTLRATENITLTAQKASLTDVIYTSSKDTDVSALIKNKEQKDKKDKTAAAADPKTAATANAPAHDGKSGTKASSARTTTPLDDYRQLTMQGIKGTITDLHITPDVFTASFEGAIDEISFPNLQTTLEHNTGNAYLNNGAVNFDFKGNLYEGTYEAKGIVSPEDQEVTINRLKLDHNKMAVNPPRMDFLQHYNNYTLNLEQVDFANLEFLSYLNSFPVSVQAMSGSLSNLRLLPAEVARGADSAAPKTAAATSTAAVTSTASRAVTGAAAIDRLLLNPVDRADHSKSAALELKLKNALYSNLLMSDVELNASLDERHLNFNIPKLRFKESTITANGSLALNDKDLSSFQLDAPDFETADLNSNLIGHMFTGKVDFHAALLSSFAPIAAPATPAAKAAVGKAALASAEAATIAEEQKDAATGTPAQIPVTPVHLFQNFKGNLTGTVTVNSEALLISDLGLDLINGGKKQNFTLNDTELMSAIQGSVAGITGLAFESSFNQGYYRIKTQMELATARAQLTTDINLLTGDISGLGNMISLARDSSTRIELTGTLEQPTFTIIALRRGEQRPGLYLPQYEASAQAKAQTDAAIILRQKGINPADPPAIETAPVLEVPANTEALKDQTLPTNSTSTSTGTTGSGTASAANADNASAAESSNVSPASAATSTDTNASVGAGADDTQVPETTEQQPDNTTGTATIESAETNTAEASSDKEIRPDAEGRVTSDNAIAPAENKTATSELSAPEEPAADIRDRAQTDDAAQAESAVNADQSYVHNAPEQSMPVAANAPQPEAPQDGAANDTDAAAQKNAADTITDAAKTTTAEQKTAEAVKTSAGEGASAYATTPADSAQNEADNQTQPTSSALSASPAQPVEPVQPTQPVEPVHPDKAAPATVPEAAPEVEASTDETQQPQLPGADNNARQVEEQAAEKEALEQERLKREADATEMELLKDALIESIVSGATEEEELIF